MKKKTIHELLANIYYSVPEAETLTIREHQESLETDELHILRLLSSVEKKSPEKIARVLGMDMRTLERNFLVLQQKGCITEVYELTEKGQEHLNTYQKTIREDIGTMIQDMSDEDVNTIIKGLGLLDEYLQQITCNA